MTTKTTTKPKTATKAKSKTKEISLETLLQEYNKANKEANAAASAARKIRKDLYIAMLNANVTEIESEGLAADRFAKETPKIDPIQLQKYLTPEQFWEVIKIGKGDAQQFVSDAIIDSCSVIEVSNEDVHLRK